MLDAITVGEKIRMTKRITSDYPIDSTATILYIDDFDVVSIVWADGKLSSLPNQR